MDVSHRHVVICEGTRSHAATAAGLVARSLLIGMQRGARASVALAGGSTPAAVYRELAGLGLDWARVDVFWGDERAVPPSHEHSNYRQARELLLESAGIPGASTHRIPGEASDLELAAMAYEQQIRRLVGDSGQSEDSAQEPLGTPRFDLVLLGMGDDGHTASLMPRTESLRSRDRLVVATSGGNPVDARLTLTFEAINAARTVVVLVTGASKAGLVAGAIRGELDVHTHPIAGVAPPNGELYWVLDREAAAEL